MKMPNSADKSEKTQANTVSHIREDSEYVRLVISNEPRTAEADTLQSQLLAKWSFAWWIKALIWFLVGTIILLVFMKWGVPFLFEKVCVLPPWSLLPPTPAPFPKSKTNKMEEKKIKNKDECDMPNRRRFISNEVYKTYAKIYA